jgi:hypothetical protein
MLRKAIGPALPLALKDLKIKMPGSREEFDTASVPIWGLSVDTAG